MSRTARRTEAFALFNRLTSGADPGFSFRGEAKDYVPACTLWARTGNRTHFWQGSRACLTLIRRGRGGGGPWWPPLDISRDYLATREALATTLYDNFLSSFPHILTPNLWRPGVRFRSYVTLCTCTSDRKWLQNVILCTKSMQIEFSHLLYTPLFLRTVIFAVLARCGNSRVVNFAILLMLSLL